MAEAIIDIRDLSKSYGAKRVLQDVNLRVPRGAVVGLMGTNGAGKSTLIKCLLGLLHADGGRADMFGFDCWDLPPAAKERLGYVPQVVYLYGWMKVRHVIAYTASFYAHWDHAWAEELAARWHVPLDDRVQTLSTGQLQTVALVLALAHRPELLVLDEPVASLDPIARRDFLRSLLDLAEDQSRTVLFSTHISSDLERVATHVAILLDGRIAYYSPLDDLKDRVKRLRLWSEADLPGHFAVPGALRTKVVGKSALAAVPNVTQELVDDLRKRWHAEVRVEDLNLEEIFVELNTHA
ncbi:MAG: ABC transporter ATP-binding protein [Planctomycetia bacterium]|nr:ABC transporter ATP-binding protein [Planctomycetia bacterium]